MSSLPASFSRLDRAFDLDSEKNIPALYSAANLMFSALLLSFIAFRHKISGTPWRSWLGLAAVLCFLSLDEAILIHEPVAPALQGAFGISEDYYYVWIIPYTVIAGLLGLLYLKFLLQLPKRTRTLFLFSGTVFILGAAGFELFSNLHVQAAGTRETVFYQLLLICEEFLEMFGVLVFIYALFEYITNQFGSFGVIVGDTVTKIEQLEKQPQENKALMRNPYLSKR